MATRLLSFADYVRARREEVGLSIRAVHRALGGKPTVSALALMEKGGYGPPSEPDTIRRWAKIIKAEPVRMLALAGIPVDRWKESERKTALSPEMLEVLAR